MLHPPEPRLGAVTGAAGFVGAEVVRQLLRQGRRVVAIDNLSVGSWNRLPESDDLALAWADIRDRDALGAVFQRYQPAGVLHLAAHHFIPFCVAHPADTLSVNVVGTQNVLDAAAAACERLVFLSTGDVYIPSQAPHQETDAIGSDNVYGLSKEMGERLIALWRGRGATVEPVIVRLFNVIGPGETNRHVMPDILACAREGDALRLGNTQARRDYIYVGDVAHCLINLLEAKGVADEIVNLGTGKSWSVCDLIDALAAESGREFRIESDPEKMRPSDRPILQAGISKLDAMLPDRPRTSLRESIRSLLQREAPELLRA